MKYEKHQCLHNCIYKRKDLSFILLLGQKEDKETNLVENTQPFEQVSSIRHLLLKLVWKTKPTHLRILPLIYISRILGSGAV